MPQPVPWCPQPRRHQVSASAAGDRTASLSPQPRPDPHVCVTASGCHGLPPRPLRGLVAPPLQTLHRHPNRPHDVPPWAGPASGACGRGSQDTAIRAAAALIRCGDGGPEDQETLRALLARGISPHDAAPGSDRTLLQEAAWLNRAWACDILCHSGVMPHAPHDVYRSSIV